jgi:hypothetical protein
MLKVLICLQRNNIVFGQTFFQQFAKSWQQGLLLEPVKATLATLASLQA